MGRGRREQGREMMEGGRRGGKREGGEKENRER